MSETSEGRGFKSRSRHHISFLRIFFRNRQITKPSPRLVQGIRFPNGKTSVEHSRECSINLEKSKSLSLPWSSHLFASDVATGISLTREGAMLANMPLHGIDSKFDRVVIDKPMESMRMLGSNLDYTYRVPPAILRRRRKFVKSMATAMIDSLTKDQKHVTRKPIRRFSLLELCHHLG